MTKNARISGKTVKVKRQDIRIPLDFYNRLKKIAVERFNAPIHHRSNEPAITPTLLKLAELGIEYLESGLADKKTEITATEVFKRLENLEQSQSDNNTDKLSEELADRIKKLEEQLADNNADKKMSETLERLEKLETHLADINTDTRANQVLERLESLERQLADNNTDTTSKDLAARLEKVEKQIADINTDIIPNKPSETRELEEIEEIDNRDCLPLEEDDLPPSSQLSFNTDNNSDNNTDKNCQSLLDDEPLVKSPDSTATVVEVGLSDSELAVKLGVNASTVNRWRTGRSKPRGKNLQRLKQWFVKGEIWYRRKAAKT